MITKLGQNGGDGIITLVSLSYDLSTMTNQITMQPGQLSSLTVVCNSSSEANCNIYMGKVCVPNDFCGKMSYSARSTPNAKLLGQNDRMQFHTKQALLDAANNNTTFIQIEVNFMYLGGYGFYFTNGDQPNPFQVTFDHVNFFEFNNSQTQGPLIFSDSDNGNIAIYFVDCAFENVVYFQPGSIATTAIRAYIVCIANFMCCCWSKLKKKGVADFWFLAEFYEYKLYKLVVSKHRIKSNIWRCKC